MDSSVIMSPSISDAISDDAVLGTVTVSISTSQAPGSGANGITYYSIVSDIHVLILLADSMSAKNSGASGSMATIVGVSVGVAVLVMVGVAGMLVSYRARRTEGKYGADEDPTPLQGRPVDKDPNRELADVLDDVFQNESTQNLGKSIYSAPLQKDQNCDSMQNMEVETLAQKAGYPGATESAETEADQTRALPSLTVNGQQNASRSRALLTSQISEDDGYGNRSSNGDDV
jgi:hypothetical protein